MGKGDRRSKRRKKAQDDFAAAVALAATPKREQSGRKSRAGKARDPGVETKKARCRQMGLQITKANLRDISAPWWGCRAGQAIGNMVLEPDERAALWDAICHMRKVVAQHDRAMQMPRRHPVCMRLLVQSEINADDLERRPDDRSAEDRVRDACLALMNLERCLGYTDKPAASEAKRVVIFDEIVLDEAGLISALRCISDDIKGKDLKYRGRAGY